MTMRHVKRTAETLRNVLFVCKHLFYLLVFVVANLSETLLKLLRVLPQPVDGQAEVRAIWWRSRLGIGDALFACHFISWPVNRVEADRILAESVTTYGFWRGGVMLAEFDMPVHECLHVDAAPFAGLSSFYLARRLLIVSNHTFEQVVDGRLGSSLKTNVAMLPNSGRCGSTLICKMVAKMCPTVMVFSEPTYLPAVAASIYRMQREAKLRFISRVLRYENRPVNGKWGYFIKPTHVFVTLISDIHDSLPTIKFAYMDRRNKAQLIASTYCLYSALWAASITRIITKYRLYTLLDRIFSPPQKVIQMAPKFVAKLDLNNMLDYSVFMVFYHVVLREHTNDQLERKMPYFFYEDLIGNPEAELRRMAEFCLFSEPLNVAAAVEVLSADAQAGTPISNKRLRALRIGTVDEWSRRKFDAYLDTLRRDGVPVDPLDWDALHNGHRVL